MLNVSRNSTEELVEALMGFERWSNNPELQHEFRSLYRMEIEEARKSFTTCPRRDRMVCSVVHEFRGAGGTYQYYVDHDGNLCLSTHRAYGREGEATQLGFGLW